MKLLHIGLCVSEIENGFQKAFKDVLGNENYFELSTGEQHLNVKILQKFNECKPDVVFFQIQAENIVGNQTFDYLKSNGAYVINWTGDKRNIVFDGTNDFVNIPSFAGVTSLTMECFIKTNSTNFKTFLYGTSQASSFCPRISFRSNTINLYFQSVGTGDVIFTFGSINAGTIYHIAYTFDSTSSHNCYLNTVLGTRTSTSTGLNGVPSFTNLTIGQGAGSDGFFSGNFYGLRIYNRALSLSEITQNYNALKGRFGL